MISVLDKVKTEYKSDSIVKNYFIVFRDKGIMLDNTQITTESLSITESICSSGNFKVGLCESANCKVSTVLTDNVKGDEICVFQTLEGFNPVITVDDTEGLQITEPKCTKLTSSFTSTNIISGLDTDNFSKDEDYLILAKLKYIGNPIYLYVETEAETSRMVYYLKPGLFNFSNIPDWDAEHTYIDSEGEEHNGYIESYVVKHNDFVWESLTAENTDEPSDNINTWQNITRYVQIAIPIVGNEFYEYKKGIYVNTSEGYGTLAGHASIYKLDVPIMPLGLFTVRSCKRKDDNNIRNLEAYDRMQDVGLDVDVIISGDNITPGVSEIQLGVILDTAASTTQIVIGSNLSKEPVNPLLLNEENIPFPDFPSDDISTEDVDEGIIYKVTQNETQKLQADYEETSAVNKTHDTVLYQSMVSDRLIDADDNNWSTYLANGSLMVPSRKRRKTIIKEDSQQWTRDEYTKGWNWYGWVQFPGDVDPVEVFGYTSGSTPPKVGDSFDGGTIVSIEEGPTRDIGYTNERVTKGYSYPVGSYYYQNNLAYKCVSSTVIRDTGWNGRNRTITNVCTFERIVQCGYYYSKKDRTWPSEDNKLYYRADTPYNDDFVDENGNKFRALAYIKTYKNLYWKYGFDDAIINEMLSNNWVFSEDIGSTKTFYRLLEEREGNWYDDANIGVMYSVDPVYESLIKVYTRDVIYKWYESATLKKMSYVVPQNIYDNTMAYTVYLTYPTDGIAYTGERGVKELANQQIANFVSEDGMYISEGTFNIDRESLVQAAIVDNSTKVAEVEEGQYTIDGSTYVGGLFYVYWVSELVYNCYKSYNGETFEQDYSLSGVIRAANPFNSCVSHSTAEKFNSMQVIWGAETAHGTRRSIISGFMEIHGMFINFDRWGVSTTRNVKASTLYPAENLYPHDSTIPGNEAYGDIYPSIGSTEVTDVSICKSIYIDDDLNTDFDGVLISKSQVSAQEANLYPFYYNRLSKRYGALPSTMPEVGYWEGNNYYKIENNFFIDNFIFDINQLKAICQQILNNIGNLQYFNLTAELRALPYMEVGDNINIMTPRNGYETAILRRTMKGNLAQMDSIETDFYD